MGAILRRTATLVVAGALAFAAIGAVELVSGGGDALAQRARDIEPPKPKDLPSLSYRPQSTREEPRYEGTVGILTVRDHRNMKFYGGSDSYFMEPVDRAINESLFYELKASRIFDNAVSIEVDQTTPLTREYLAELARANNVEFIFASGLHTFNLVREKKVKSKDGAEFILKIRFNLFGQLIQADTGSVLWAEEIEHEFSDLNITGKVGPGDYAGNAINALKAVFEEIRQSIRSTALEVRS